ncbi:hypothetical protein UFOVP1369_26 [uncultured Caudovirales phage]|uniref:Uncharacterized protein n=1 Tax=uncultured Caudovirales phage TaxID=2100421 RepID=A0A6J5S240_9CAUD|nr:hypothetical protein UFOVP1369_26 [uncultured Caudovirales phage]
MFTIPTGDALVEFIKDFTGSTNDDEIKKCIFMAEMSMRNIELPALRSDPYAVENIGIADENGRIPIPGDMNKPILFFKQGQQVTTTATATGTSGQYTILLTSTPSRTISNNMSVTGTGIGAGALISNVSTGISGATITLNVANTGTVSGTLVFSTTGNQSSQTGPWIVYDRIGDRDIITQGMIAQLYLQPVNVPAVIRGKFSEVYNKYQFLPYVAQGDLINMYYYKAWPLLFAPVTDEVISATGTVGTISGSGPWTARITGMTGVGDLQVGDEIYATAGTGSLGTGGVYTVASILSATSISFTATGGTTPTAGTVTGVTQTGLIVQNNAVLQTWPEGYVYSTLREYYIKRHNDTDAAVYQQKFEAAFNTVEDQNNLGKWSGGHTRLTSVWQPRQYRQYNIK